MTVFKDSQDNQFWDMGRLDRPPKPDSGPKEGYMLALWNKVKIRFQDEKGASMVEYALLVVLIAIVALIAISLAGQQVSQTFSTIADALTNT